MSYRIPKQDATEPSKKFVVEIMESSTEPVFGIWYHCDIIFSKSTNSVLTQFTFFNSVEFDTVKYKHVCQTERQHWVSDIAASYSGRPRFKYRPGD
jgi:hypothetical protein